MNDDRGPDRETAPLVLFFNDFPPSNINGGTVLIKRLLRGYPGEKLIAVTRSQHSTGDAASSGWCGSHILLPGIEETGRWGIARLKGLLNWLLIPVLAFRVKRLMRGRSVSAIVSVASGTYFLAAALVSKWMSLPFVLIVHDDWVPIVSNALHAPQSIFRFLMKLALRRANHVFVVSEGMQEMLKAQYGVDAEIQMPATETWDLESTAGKEGTFRILYMGNGVSAQDSLSLLVRMIRNQTLGRYGLSAVELHLCTPWRVDDDPAIKNHGWVSESEARRQIAASDVLFLPYSFTSGDKAVTTTSFPAKGADYLASGKAILVLGPPDSSIVRYARRFACAEVVTQLDESMLAEAIRRLAFEEDHRRQLSRNALQAFQMNHNIALQQKRFADVIRGLAGR